MQKFFEGGDTRARGSLPKIGKLLQGSALRGFGVRAFESFQTSLWHEFKGNSAVAVLVGQSTRHYALHAHLQARLSLKPNILPYGNINMAERPPAAG